MGIKDILLLLGEGLVLSFVNYIELLFRNILVSAVALVVLSALCLSTNIFLGFILGYLLYLLVFCLPAVICVGLSLLIHKDID